MKTGSICSTRVEHGKCEQETNQGSRVHHTVIIKLINQLAVLLYGPLHPAAQEQGRESRNDEPAMTEKSRAILSAYRDNRK